MWHMISFGAEQQMQPASKCSGAANGASFTPERVAAVVAAGGSESIGGRKAQVTDKNVHTGTKRLP